MHFDHEKPVICLMGPTASGKSQLALALASRLKSEIISVDSTLVYRGFDIGSAKPTQAERQDVPHHLIDIRAPEESYSAAQFVAEARHSIDQLHQAGKRPILVGGTMLYYRALQIGLSNVPATNSAYRAQLQAQLTERGLPALYQQLQESDPIAAASIHPNDPQRILRALEVQLSTGRPISSFWENKPDSHGYVFYNFSCLPQCRRELHQNIEQRFDAMLRAGLIAEVENLIHDKPHYEAYPAFKSVGYRQVLNYLNGTYDYNTMRQKALVATRQLAKRQMTWLRHWPLTIHQLATVDRSPLDYIQTLVLDT